MTAGSKHQMKKTMKLERALAVSLCFTFVLLLCLLALTVHWRIRRDNESEGKEQMICETCSSLNITGTPPHGCYKAKEESCCCKTSQMIDGLVNKFLENKYYYYTNQETAAILERNCALESPTGKIAGLDYDALKNERREPDLVYWNTSHLSIINNVQYLNERFIIDVPGFYRVFSRIKYGHDTESAKNPAARQTHFLLRYSYRQGRYEKLVENTRTFPQLHVAKNNGTSFIETVVKCYKDDQLMIKSSHTHILSGDYRENDFGVLFISR